jgi:hypothetical protein
VAEVTTNEADALAKALHKAGIECAEWYVDGARTHPDFHRGQADAIIAAMEPPCDCTPPCDSDAEHAGEWKR